MSKFRIPKVFITGFQLISNLKESDINHLFTLINHYPIGMGSDSLVKCISDEDTKFKPKDLDDIINTIFSIYRLKSTYEGDIEDFSSGLVDAFSEDESVCKGDVNEDLKLSLKRNLDFILTLSNNLAFTEKAYGLLRDNNKTFETARIITDIRIVYNDEIDSPKQNALIVHKLKISYQENDESKDIFIAADLSDLMKLQETINRAIKKESSIINNYSNTFSFIRFE